MSRFMVRWDNDNHEQPFNLWSDAYRWYRNVDSTFEAASLLVYDDEMRRYREVLPDATGGSMRVHAALLKPLESTVGRG